MTCSTTANTVANLEIKLKWVRPVALLWLDLFSVSNFIGKPSYYDRIMQLQIRYQILSATTIWSSAIKFLAAKHRFSTSDDWVYLKLQTHRKNTIRFSKDMKLKAKYYGPFKDLRKVEGLSFQLQLPPN